MLPRRAALGDLERPAAFSFGWYCQSTDFSPAFSL